MSFLLMFVMNWPRIPARKGLFQNKALNCQLLLLNKSSISMSNSELYYVCRDGKSSDSPKDLRVFKGFTYDFKVHR